MKKYLLFILIVLPAISFAQVIAYDRIDEFTENREIQVNASKKPKWSESDAITKNIFKGHVFLSTKVVKNPEGEITVWMNLQIRTQSILCFSNDKIILLFENKEKLTLNQISKLDCGTVNDVKYYLTDTDIDTLKKSKLEKLRIYTRDGYLDYDIKDKVKGIIEMTFGITQEKLKEVGN